MTTCTYQGLQYAVSLRPKRSIENISINRVVNKVCARYGISTSDLSNKSRKADLVEARRFVINFLRETTDITLVKLAELLKRDHTTIMWSIDTHKSLMAYDKGYKVKYNRLVDDIYTGV